MLVEIYCTMTRPSRPTLGEPFQSLQEPHYRFRLPLIHLEALSNTVCKCKSTVRSRICPCFSHLFTLSTPPSVADIDFGITAEREEGTTIVREHGRISAEEPNDTVDVSDGESNSQKTSSSSSHIIQSKFLVGEVPCLLQFTFDNTYSWITEKLVHYRIVVTPPSPHSLALGRHKRVMACYQTIEENHQQLAIQLQSAQQTQATLQREIESLKQQLEAKHQQYERSQTDLNTVRSQYRLRQQQRDLLLDKLQNGWEDEKQLGIKLSKVPSRRTSSSPPPAGTPTTAANATMPKHQQSNQTVASPANSS
jgi:hypothetical protein